MYALIDCNNFFVSCERLFRPDLHTKPIAVLSNNDGCFISRSDEAKAAGLPMGAPLFKHRQTVRNHQIELFSANFELYGDISERIVTLLREVTPLVEVYSIDECFMDLRQLAEGSDDRERWALRLRDRILGEIGVPVSIGIGPTKTLAKVASTYAKSRGGVYEVSDDAHREALLRELPVESVWGIGWRLAPKLCDKGISTAWQLVSASDAWLRQQVTITGMRTVWELRGEPHIAFGDKYDARKSIMRSRMFGHKVREYHQLESAVATFTAQAAARLRQQDSVARQILVFLSADRHTPGHSRVYLSTTVLLSEASADSARLIAGALEGLEYIYDDQFAYQKTGVTLLGIVPRDKWQLSMLSSEDRRDERTDLMYAVDRLNQRYGNVIYHAAERPLGASWRSKRERRSPRYTTQWGELPWVS